MKKVQNHQQPHQQRVLVNCSSGPEESSSKWKDRSCSLNNIVGIPNSPTTQEGIGEEHSCLSGPTTTTHPMNNAETFRISNTISSEDKDSSSSSPGLTSGGLNTTKSCIAAATPSGEDESNGGGAFYIGQDGRKPLLSPVKTNKGRKKASNIIGSTDDGGSNGNGSPREVHPKKNKINYSRESKSQPAPNSTFPFPTTRNSSSLFSLAIVLVRFFILLSVSGLLLGTLLWFHVRLTSLEDQVRTTIHSQTDKVRVQPAERNAQESQQELYYQQGSHHSHQFHSDRPTITSRLVGDQHDSNGRVMSQAFPSDRSTSIPTSTTTSPRYWSDDVKPPVRVKRRVDSPPANQRERSRSNPNLSGYNVEFINPKLREDMERSGGGGSPIDQTAGSSSTNQESSPNANTVPDDDWVWLTSYSRIPLLAIQEFCSATKEYCPKGDSGAPGLTGNPGKPGSKGERGDHGLPGEAGSRGPQGPPGLTGMRGPKGEPGIPGLPGADGRDGLPGEPGLDGIPGRSGLDGIPGIDGIPGLDGRPGTNGTNGADGTPGPPGPHGPTGPRGLPGPQGRQGLQGLNGRDGIPGINAWLYNGTSRAQLLIPPSIVGGNTKARPLVVNEREHVRLRCTASGVPRPNIKWQRVDGSPIRQGSWQSSGDCGPVLNLTSITREHMGEYLCIADNGVTPWQQRSFVVEVHFPPMIRIQNQMVGASIAFTATLDCYVEAFPHAVTYWERSDGRVLENGEKYQIATKESGMYKIHMMLNVTKVTTNDLGRYHCIAKNELGITKGDFTVYEVDPSVVTAPPKSHGGKGVAIYGQVQPEHKAYEDLCPTAPPCAECPPTKDTGKCISGGFALLDMVGWEIFPLGNLSTPSPTNRTQDCVLSAVGKPVFNRFTNSTSHAGCWMRDPVGMGVYADKYWVTKMDDPNHLYEFVNKTAYTRDKFTRTYFLPFPFKGNFHAIHNGSFFYVTESKEGNPRIVRLDLVTGKTNGDLELPYASFSASTLYMNSESYVDLATDENGLWAIHTLEGSNNTAVVKIHVDPENMMILYGWNVTISHTYAGDMFIICGVLYAVDSVVERDTKIRLALDLYRRKLLKVDLGFSNPFRLTSMVSYNPRTKELLTWDKGNQLIYPVKYTDIGYAREKEEKPEEFYGIPVTHPPSHYNNNQ